MTLNPGAILPWMKFTKYTKKKINAINSYDYLVYCHSFTDAQLFHGEDEFCNTFEWLKFTLSILAKKNKKVLIKSHPNYFNKTLGIKSYYDRLIFNFLKKKYSCNKNFYFIDKPIHNYNLMKNLSKKCILITHHGSVISETIIFNLKSIASTANFFSQKYKVSNLWSNKKEYKNLLMKNWTMLKQTKEKDLLNLFHNYYFHKYSWFGKRNWTRTIAKNIKMSYSIFLKNYLNSSEKKNFNFNEFVPPRIHKKIIKNLDRCIMKI